MGHETGKSSLSLRLISSTRDTNTISLSTAYTRYLVFNTNATSDDATNNNAIAISNYSGCTIKTIYTASDTGSDTTLAESVLLVTRTGSGKATITFSGFAGRGWRCIVGIE